MVSGKKRLYVALYPSGTPKNEERKYHWGFLVGPKAENHLSGARGWQYHVKNSGDGIWRYEAVEVDNVTTKVNLLARILIAKVEDEKRLLSLFKGIPLVQSDPNWRCRTWIQEALGVILKGGKVVGTAELDWKTIEETGRKYVAQKHAEGRYRDSTLLDGPRPTWDLLENKEVIA